LDNILASLKLALIFPTLDYNEPSFFALWKRRVS